MSIDNAVINTRWRTQEGKEGNGNSQRCIWEPSEMDFEEAGNAMIEKGDFRNDFSLESLCACRWMGMRVDFSLVKAE